MLVQISVSDSFQLLCMIQVDHQELLFKHLNLYARPGFGNGYMTPYITGARVGVSSDYFVEVRRHLYC